MVRAVRAVLVMCVVAALLPAAGAAQSAAPASEQNKVAGQATPGAAVPPAEPQAADLPPAGSPPLLRFIQFKFEPVDQSVIDPQTYLYYVQTQPSRPSTGVWVPYTEQTEKSLIEDFRRLWNTNFLDNLWIEVQDAPWPNGVAGKHVVLHMEERQRVKLVDYVGSGADKLTRAKIDEKLREQNVQIRLDSFIDLATVRRVEGIIREMLAEQGYLFSEVRHETKEVAGGPKLVHLTVHVERGPKVKIREIEFVGNQAVGDGTLKRKMKDNKAHRRLVFFSTGGTYREDKFAEDAEKVVEHYRNKGYVTARVGQPELKYLQDTDGGETRWVQLRIPVYEGERYRVGTVSFDGNTVVRTQVLQDIFRKIKPGKYYSEKDVRKGLDKAREVYGSLGYFEFTAYPDLKPRDQAGAPGAPDDGKAAGAAKGADSLPVRHPQGDPLADVTMRVQEGKQYFVNRITFIGNTSTRDNVIRRELRLVENGVFNTEALKLSVRRVNQLGYFKQLENDGVKIDKAPGADNKVDVTLKLEEQNRNQLTFGAGVSQWEGFFGQLAFQTANFLGRGETLSLSVQSGSRAQNYQLAFTEPFLFDRPITGGVDVYRREIRFINQFTQRSAGGNVIFGFPVALFTRMFLSYSYEQVKVKELNDLFRDPLVLQRNPYLADSLLIGQGGERTVSKVTPSLVHNTVDNPIFPNAGRRYTLSLDFAGFGGNTKFYKPRAEGVWFFQHTQRTSVGFRAQVEYVRPFGNTQVLPIFERLFLGGEYSIRGFDIRSIGPQDAETGLVLGGNKALLFNAEYLISVAGPVRLVLFYDAGQVKDRGQPFSWKDPIMQRVQTAPFVPASDSGVVRLTDTPGFSTLKVGETSAFKTSTGAEVRFFMPVLNVPFRLIFAFNPQRTGVLDNNFKPQAAFSFRFAVGSTF